MAPVAGFLFKIDINGTPYAATNVRVVDRATGLDITNSEGVTGSGAEPVPGFETRIAGNGAADVTITNASWDAAEDPFGVPLAVSSGSYINVTYYIIGRGGGKAWSFPALYVDSVEQAADVKGLQPVTISGTTDGIYFLPN